MIVIEQPSGGSEANSLETGTKVFVGDPAGDSCDAILQP
jgi:hypothetical protein